MAHKLLLADDSVTIQRVIELTFADEDIEVTTVGDGQLAIDRLDTDPPDIILADVDMPKRDGYEVAAYVKSRPKLAHIPVVLLTGAFEPIDQARAAAAGSSDVLAKPFEPQMVINRVKELLGRKRPDDEATVASRGGARRPAPSAAAQMSDPAAGRPPAGGRREPARVARRLFRSARRRVFESAAGASQSDGADEWIGRRSRRTCCGLRRCSGKPARRSGGRRWRAAPHPPSRLTPLRRASHRVRGGCRCRSQARHRPIAVAGRCADPHPSRLMPSRSATPLNPSYPHLSRPRRTRRTRRTVAPIAPVAPVASVAPIAPVARTPTFARRRFGGRAVETTANPFANLSAAKAEAAARPAAPVISDEVIEEIVSRVLQRISDHVVRETQ